MMLPGVTRERTTGNIKDAIVFKDADIDMIRRSAAIVRQSRLLARIPDTQTWMMSKLEEILDTGRTLANFLRALLNAFPPPQVAGHKWHFEEGLQAFTYEVMGCKL